MKKKFNDFFVKAFLIFIIGAFILFGISNFLFGISRYNLFKVGKRKVSVIQFSNALNQSREMMYKNNPSESDMEYISSPQFKYEVLSNMVREELLNNEVYEWGINQTEKSSAKTIAQNEMFWENGKFDSVRFQAFLNNVKLTEKEYLTLFGEYYGRTILMDSLYGNPLLINGQIDSLLKYENQIRSADVITINTKNLPIQIKKPSVEEKKEFYNAYKDSFFVPEKRKLSYVEVDVNKYMQNVSASEKEVRAEYDNNRDLYKKEEIRDLYYLASKNKNTAKIIKSELDKGGDALSLAKEYLNREKEYVLVTDVKRGMLDERLEKIVGVLKENEYSDVVENNGFYAIFYIVKIYPEKQIPYNDVKLSIKNDLIKNRKEEISIQTISKLEDMLLSAKNLKEVANEFGLKVNDLGFVSQQELMALRFGDTEELQMLFNYQEGDFSNLIHTNGDNHKYRIFFVEGIKPKKMQAFEDVEKQIEREIINDKRIDAVNNMLNEISEKLTAKNLNQFTEKYSFNVNKNVTVARDNKNYSQDFISNLYSLKNVNDISAISKEGENVYRLSLLRSVKKLNENSKQYVSRVDLMKRLNDSLQNSVLANYYNYLQGHYKIVINEKILESVE